MPMGQFDKDREGLFKPGETRLVSLEPGGILIQPHFQTLLLRNSPRKIRPV